jgi:hypothetical protein
MLILKFFKPNNQNLDLYLLAMFKEITMCQDLLENQFSKCQTLVEKIKTSFIQNNSKIEVIID